MLKIGNLELKNNLILGPMAGYTDLPFRLICEKFNVGLTVTEMVSSKALFYNDEKTKFLLNNKLGEIEETNTRAVQLFGHETESLVYSVKYINDNNLADIIDINMGCPAKKVTKNGDGSSLLLDEKLVGILVKETVKASKVPVTVKIRKGYDEDHINYLNIGKIIEENGASAITIHGRVRTQFFSGENDLDSIKALKEAVRIPVIGNGDIRNYEDAIKMLEYTKCDGIMISRGTLGNPWIFREINERMAGKEVTKVSKEELIEIIIEHINLEIMQKAYETKDEKRGEIVGIREMRKHIGCYIRNMPNASSIRNKVNQVDKKEKVIEILKSI